MHIVRSRAEKKTDFEPRVFSKIQNNRKITDNQNSNNDND